MSFLGALARSNLNDPSSPLDLSLGDWLGGGRTRAGVVVNERRVYGLTAYYRGVALLAGTMAGLPFHVYVAGTREKVVQRTVLDNPNPRQTPFEFWQTMYANAITWGNGYARKVRDGAGIVRQVWPIHPSRVVPKEVEPTEANPAGKVFLVSSVSGQVVLTPDEVFHIPYLSIDGVSGLRPLELFRQVLGIGLAAEDSSANFYGQGTSIGGVLSTEQKLSNDSADAIKSRWRQKHTGSQNAGDIAVLDRGLTFTPLALPPGDAQLLESRDMGVDEVGRILGLPPHMLGQVDKSTSWGTGIESQTTGLVVFNVQHWLNLVEQRTTRELLPGGWTAGPWYAKHAVEGLLRGDSKARAEFYNSMIRGGIMTPNEARALEDLEPIAGGDERLLPAGVIPESLARMATNVNSLGGLVRAGFEPEPSALALDMEPIAHTGLVPITVTPLEVSGTPAPVAAD